MLYMGAQTKYLRLCVFASARFVFENERRTPERRKATQLVSYKCDFWRLKENARDLHVPGRLAMYASKYI